MKNESKLFEAKYRIDPVLLEDRLEELAPLVHKFISLAEHLAWDDFDKEDEYYKKNKAFRYIPFKDISIIARTVNLFPKAKTFIDLGCGVPIIQIVLEHLFNTKDALFTASGVEIRTNLFDKVRSTHMHGELYNYDITELTSEFIQKYDIIYYYRPISDTDRMNTFEVELFAKLKPGQVIIPVYTLLHYNEVKGLKRVNPSTSFGFGITFPYLVKI